jgi:hypothetical protein
MKIKTLQVEFRFFLKIKYLTKKCQSGPLSAIIDIERGALVQIGN